MSFASQLFKNTKKVRNKVPTKGTISYCKYQIEKIKESKKSRVEQAPMIRYWEEKIEELRDAKRERRADKICSENRRYTEKIAELDMTISLLRQEINELQKLAKIMEESDDKGFENLVKVIVTLDCSVTGENGIYIHRKKLPYPFSNWSRNKLTDLVVQLIKFGKLSRVGGRLKAW